jgi:hypothetical protein
LALVVNRLGCAGLPVTLFSLANLPVTTKKFYYIDLHYKNIVILSSLTTNKDFNPSQTFVDAARSLSLK